VYYFSYSIEIIVASDNQYGSFINGSWTGIMKLLRADITFGIGHSEKRRKYVLFSMPYIQKPIKVLYRGLRYEEWNYMFFLKPFQIEMWKSILFVLALTLILMTCEFRLHNCTASKIIFTSFCFFSLILLQIFISRLTAVFSVVIPKVPFQSFEEMVEKQQYFPIIMKGYKEEEAFSSSTIKSWQLGWQLIQKNQPHSIVKNFSHGIEVAYNAKAGFFTAAMNVAKIIEKNCSFSFAPFDFGEETGCFAYSPNFPHYRHFNNK
uniref:Uncharacterized protein n=1 Tax=Strigamia maritima TaxID=126957 RepID=T1JLW4_STRMM